MAKEKVNSGLVVPKKRLYSANVNKILQKMSNRNLNGVSKIPNKIQAPSIHPIDQDI